MDSSRVGGDETFADTSPLSRLPNEDVVRIDLSLLSTVVLHQPRQTRKLGFV